MMNNPQFYIFGVPDGFDMYNATPERLRFFQLMYNGEYVEDRKMIIYRKDDNSEVTYMYLRYNMLSFMGRPSSFLGMALTFSEGYYCTDISRLLNLFDTFYAALSDDVLLTKKGAVGQGRFLVRSFAEKTAVIIKMEEIVESQTRVWFGDCIVPMDETFRKGTQNVSRKSGLYTDTKSEHIIANLKTASWLFLSGRQPQPTQQRPPQQPQPRQEEPPQQRPPQQPQPRQEEPPQQRPPQEQPPQQRPQQQSPELQQSSRQQVEAEKQRQQKDLLEIKKDFEKERNTSYYKLSKTDLQRKLGKFEELQRRIYTLGYASSSPEGGGLCAQISSEIDRIYRLRDTIERNKKKKKIIFSSAGFIVIGIIMFISFPKQPTLPGDGDWATTKIVLSSQIDSLYTHEIKPFEDDNLNKYSQNSNNDNYKSAKLHLDECKEQLMGAKQIVDNDDSVFRGICADNIHEASNQLRLARECWESFMEDLADSLSTQSEGCVSKMPGSGGATKTTDTGGAFQKTASSDSSSATGKSGAPVIDPGKWRLKINGQWTEEGWEYKIGTGTRVKIEVYNGNNPVNVLWDWPENLIVHTKGLEGQKKESNYIEVSLKQGRANLGFWIKDNIKDKKTIYLLPNS